MQACSVALKGCQGQNNQSFTSILLVGGDEIDMQEQVMAVPPSTVRPPTSLYLLGEASSSSYSKVQCISVMRDMLMLINNLMIGLQLRPTYIWVIK